MNKNRTLWLIIATVSGLLPLVLLPLVLLSITGAAQQSTATATTAGLDVVINEVAWMGTVASYSDEWIELHNTTATDLDLGGWTLSDGGDISLTLSGVITADGYYLLERGDDAVITDVVADLIYSGNLANDGETLTLRDATGTIIDTANGDGGSWPAGDSPNRRTMERVDPTAPDEGTNWADNDGTTRNGHDADDHPVNGTPGARNSAYVPPPPPQADLVVTKSGPPTAFPGDVLTYTIHLSNAGDLTASAVRLTDTLPAGVTFLDTGTLLLPNGGQELHWAVGEIAPGTPPLVITISAQVSETAWGTLVNVVTATTATTETVTANNVATCTTQVIVPAMPRDVVLNEVAWMGTVASYSDEWIELHNTTATDLDLGGWALSDGGDINLTLSGVITAGGYYLLERGDDAVITDVVADLIYSGNLANDGETLTLRDATGTVIDTANGDGGSWPAGDNETKRTMERVDPTAPDNEDNWANSDDTARNGTPGARNSAYLPPPQPQADLVVTKSGPPTASPGDVLTYTIHLSNAGDLTASAVRLTDTLPAGVLFLDTGTLFLPEQKGRTLRWTAGEVMPGTPPLVITISARVSETAWGTLVNVVTATTTATETVTANNVAYWTTAVAQEQDARIAAALANGYTQSDDEAVQIVNAGDRPLDLAGWRLNDDADDPSYASFPPTLPVILAPGEGLWLTHDATEFRRSFGFSPDYETAGSDPTVPDLNGNWPGYTDDGDEVALLDAGGSIVDALVYGDGEPGEVGVGHWQGAPLAYLDGVRPNGQIFSRKPDLPNTNTEADWIESTTPGAALYGYTNEGDVYGKRVRYPGWTSERFSHTLQITTTARLTVAVAPDNLYDAVAAELGRARQSLYIEGYALTHLHLGRLITELITTRGVSVTVLLDEALYRGENREKWICQQIEAAGGQVYLMHNLDDTKRYLNQHAKLIIIDERVVIISSENFGYGAMPVDDKSDGTLGNRGAALITDAGPVVQRALEIFRADADPARIDLARWGTRGFDPPPVGYTPPVTTGGGSDYRPLVTQPLALEGSFYFELVSSPENSLRVDEGLIGLLLRAGPGDTVLVEMLSENQHWGGAAGNIVDDPNPRLEAYLQAARQGATVRVLLDEAITAGSNRATIDHLNAVALSETLDLEARAQNPTGIGIHNKMVLAQVGGRGYAFVGSVNGTAAAHRRNRELGLLVESDAAYAYLKRVFDHDWQPVKWVYLPLTLRQYRGPADHLLISEVYYNPPNAPGKEETVEWIELYNPTRAAVDLGAHRLGDAAAPDDPEGMYHFPPGAAIGPGEVRVVALEATAFHTRYGFMPDFAFYPGGSTVPGMVDDPAWGSYRFSLRNTGDEVLLLDGADQVVDALAWGDSPYPCVPHPGVSRADHSLQRYPADRDSDDCTADLRDGPFPSPGMVP